MAEDSKIDPRDWLSRAESVWRPQLESVGLATEVLNDNVRAQKAAKAFGIVSNFSPQQGLKTLRDYPASTVVAFTGVAIESYEGGKFWPGFSKTCGYTVVPNEQSSWGDAYLRSLKVLGLPTFPELPKKYLGTILVHAGIPNYCLGDFFIVLERGMKHVGSDAEAIVQWAVQRQESALYSIDIPVRRFLEFGKEYAVDFVDRALDALISLTLDPDSNPDTQAPERVVEAAKAFLEANSERQSALRIGATTRKPKVSIRLNPYSGELEILLPAIEAVSEWFTWTIDTDGVTERIQPELRVRGNTFNAGEQPVRIQRPARHISVRSKQKELDYEFSLVEEKDPLLFFSEEGQLASRQASLIGTRLWALFALDGHEQDPDFKELIVRKEIPPLGWNGWQLALVDLSSEEKLRLAQGYPFHYVKTQSNARVEMTGEIPWITVEGLPVQISRPLVHLPDNITADWRVQVLDLDTNRVIVDRPEKSHSEIHDVVDPMSELATPIVGNFQVTVKGPLGRGAKRQFSLVEGMRVDDPHPWRHLSPGGLRAFTLQFSGSELHFDPSEFSLGATQVIGQVKVLGRTTELELSVQPPSMAVATVLNHVVSRWSHGFVRIDAEDIGLVTLMLRTNPNEANPSIRAMSQEKVVQFIEPNMQDGLGYSSYSLAGLTDSLRVAGALDLIVFHDQKPIRVARIEPTRIANSAEIANNTLRLSNFSGGEVEVRFWSVLAPWIPSESRQVDSMGECKIPDSMKGMGSVLVSWRRTDPWIPFSWPALPVRSEQLLIDLEPDPAICSESTLVLAGLQDPGHLASQEHAWAILHMFSHLNDLSTWHAVSGLTKSLLHETVSAMITLAESKIPSENRLSLLIRSGILWSQTNQSHSESPDDFTLERIYNSDPKVASLVIIPSFMSGHLSVQQIDLWRRLQKQHGAALTEILTLSIDPFVRAGSFAQAAQLDQLSVEQQEEIIQAAHLLPKSTLDGDSRAWAARLLFQERDQPELVSVGRNGRTRLEYQSSMLRDWHWEDALALLNARRDTEHKGGWLSLSAQSIGFALIAQLAVQGDQHAQEHLQHKFRHWLALAKYAPTLIYIDILLAACMAADQFAQTRPENPFKYVDEDEDQ